MQGAKPTHPDGQALGLQASRRDRDRARDRGPARPAGKPTRRSAGRRRPSAWWRSTAPRSATPRCREASLATAWAKARAAPRQSDTTARRPPREPGTRDVRRNRTPTRRRQRWPERTGTRSTKQVPPMSPTVPTAHPGRRSVVRRDPGLEPVLFGEQLGSGRGGVLVLEGTYPHPLHHLSIERLG